jgi:predicted nucleic acid-binding protein
MSGYLLDTNVVSELRKGQRANPNVLAWFLTVDDDDLFISVLVLGEIRSGIERIRSSDPAQAKVLERWLKGLEAAYADRILVITTGIADKWGRLSAIDLPSVVDGLLAATALENDLTLVMRNVQDVARTGVSLLNPFDAASKFT